MSSDKPNILVNTEQWRMTDESIAALQSSDDIFQCNGMLSRILTDAYKKDGVTFEDGTPRIGRLPAPTLSETLSKKARYYSLKRDKKTKKQYEREEYPPACTVQQVLSRGSWPGIRPLTGVVEYPVLRADGSVLQTPGYDEKSGLLYLPSAKFPTVPERPTRDQALAAITTLLYLVQDFPFVQPAHRSGWLAGVLTIFCRFAIDGCIPLFLIDADSAGSGKTLLASLGAVIATGRDMPGMVPTDDQEEMRKRLFSLAMNGARMVLIDNITGVVGGAALNMVLTRRSIEDRVLGRNDIVEVIWNAIVSATCNNGRVATDTHRRSIYSRIESGIERPEDREGFKISDLPAYVKEHRAEYACAALTILRAYAVYLEDGGKHPSMKTMGSFNPWSAAVRAPIIWLEQPDPYLATVEWRDQTDTTAQSIGQLLRGWKELCDNVGKPSITAAQALGHLTEDERRCEVSKRDHHRDHEQPLPSLRWTTLRSVLEPIASGRPTSKQLGELMSASKGRVVDEMRLEQDGKEHSAIRWKVAIMPTSAADPKPYTKPNGQHKHCEHCGERVDGYNVCVECGYGADPTVMGQA